MEQFWEIKRTSKEQIHKKGWSQIFGVLSRDHGAFSKNHLEHHHGNHHCKLCPKSYVDAELLSIHLEKYHGNHVCHICESRFFFESLLKDHVKTHKGKAHDNIPHFDLSSLIRSKIEKRKKQPRHWCDIGSCSENFIQEVDLQKHIEQAHRHWCKIRSCSKCFTDVESLQTHIQQDHKNLFCELCQKQFFCKFTLFMHNRHYHDPSVLKPYKCDVCGESFVHESTLKIHIREENH